MTAIRQEAIKILEEMPEDKLTYVIQIIRSVDELISASEKKETEKDDGWYCDSGCSGRVDISADQSTDIYQGPDQ